MKLIIGLGNPGIRYQKTRHNMGFMVAERFLKNFETVDKTQWEDSGKVKSDIARIEWQPRQGSLEKVILAKPKTYMNNSGLAVSLMSQYLKIPIFDIWLIHDDIDLPLGSMKIRFGGASAGHHGVESIISKLGTDKFWRFRMGIGIQSSKFKVLASRSPRFGEAGRSGQSSKLRDVEGFVLGEFRGRERGKVREIIKRGATAIEMALEKGLESAMNRFNTK